LFEKDFVALATLDKVDVDIIIRRGRHIFSDEIGFDRQLPVAAVNQHGQLDAAGAAEIIERIQGGADGAPAVEHIVHQHDSFSRDIERDIGGLDIWGNAPIQIVAMHADVEGAGVDVLTPDTCQERAQTARKVGTSALDTYQGKVLACAVAFSDFVGNSRQRPLDRSGVEYNRRVGHFP
jgi:hypothetical protein